jgi:rhodanese-related sulfurtransferase
MNRVLATLSAMALSTIALAGTLSPAEVAQQIRDPKAAPFLLDVRTPEEFAEGRVPGARNIPLQDLETRLAEVPKDRAVVVYCRSGPRAQRAAGLLRERGYSDLSLMEGSMLAWEAARLPVEK